jgi:hypothetical protein
MTISSQAERTVTYSEVLTKNRGWVRFEDVQEGDEIVSSEGSTTISGESTTKRLEVQDILQWMMI